MCNSDLQTITSYFKFKFTVDISMSLRKAWATSRVRGATTLAAAFIHTIYVYYYCINLSATGYLTFTRLVERKSVYHQYRSILFVVHLYAVVRERDFPCGSSWPCFIKIGQAVSRYRTLKWCRGFSTFFCKRPGLDLVKGLWWLWLTSVRNCWTVGRQHRLYLIY